MAERRSEPRMLCADMVELGWKDADGKRRKLSALLEDISVSGACLQTETPVPVGVSVRWCVSPSRRGQPKKEFRGTVRYCEYREIGYFVGVELDSASKWSKKMYTPQHLLDLKHLMSRTERP